MPVTERRPSGPSRTVSVTLRIMLVLAVAVPLAFLYRQVARSAEDGLALVARERHGVAYLEALVPLTDEWFDAQATAVAGESVRFPQLAAAAAAVDVVDQRWGDELRTRPRWTAIRSAIDEIRTDTPGSREATFTAYQAVSDQLVALYRRVQDQSGLLVDPGLDTHFLAVAVGVELPAGLAVAGEYADRIAVLAPGPAAEEEGLDAIGALLAAREELADRGDELSENLEVAVASTSSQTLGPDLVSELDEYRRSIDVLLGVDRSNPLASAQAAAARTVVQNAGLALQSRMLTALDGLLASRSTQLAQSERLALILLAPAAVLILIVAGVALWRLARSRSRGHEPTVADDATTWGAPPTPAGSGRVAPRIDLRPPTERPPWADNGQSSRREQERAAR
jgi:hypothetical protein